MSAPALGLMSDADTLKFTLELICQQNGAIKTLQAAVAELSGKPLTLPELEDVDRKIENAIGRLESHEEHLGTFIKANRW